MTDDPKTVIKAIVELPDRDQSYWYLGLTVAQMIAEKRFSDDPADRDFMRLVGERLRSDYEEAPIASREAIGRYVRTYWLP